MTANFVSEDTQKLLKNAIRLEKSGMSDASNQICIKCLKAESESDDGQDVIAFFYGEAIYNTINSVKKAIDAILVARCAMELYNELRTLSPASASDTSTAWALRSEETSEKNFVDFFSWLSNPREEILASDKDKIAQAIYATRKCLPLKMDSAVANMYPTAIINGVVTKEIKFFEHMLSVNGNY